MNTLPHDRDTVLAAYALARRHWPDGVAGVTLQLGGGNAALAWGAGAQPDQVALLGLGLVSVAEWLAPAGRVSAGAVEEAIAAVEDVVMPWHGRLPTDAPLATADAAVVALAQRAGMPDGVGSWWLSTDAVERLFDRWVARVQGRPASQDDIPLAGEFAATLLVLREWLHHLAFDGIAVLRAEPPERTQALPQRLM